MPDATDDGHDGTHGGASQELTGVTQEGAAPEREQGLGSAHAAALARRQDDGHDLHGVHWSTNPEDPDRRSVDGSGRAPVS